MTPETGNVLQQSLNQIDRDRRRATYRTVLLFVMMFALMLSAWFGMIFSRNPQTGLAFGLAAVIESVFIAGLMAILMIEKSLNRKTQAILKALELHGNQQPPLR
jgi:low temperature requirement protein LtrA